MSARSSTLRDFRTDAAYTNVTGETHACRTSHVVRAAACRAGLLAARRPYRSCTLALACSGAQASAACCGPRSRPGGA